MMEMNLKIKIPAHAKLNLYLEVLSRREDGYHELESDVVFLDLADELEFEAAQDLQILGTEITDNIILKTAKKLQEKFGISSGAKITLQKNIPLAAGLGGGSADAAAAIVGLKKLWNFSASDAELYSIAKEIGADVPACLYGILEDKNAVYFAGIGEKLSAKTAPENLHFVLVNPLKKLSTADVFKGISAFNPPTESDDFMQRRNDLEAPAKKLMPEILEVLQAISSEQNCRLSRMTGSGATCFGVLENAEHAEAAKENLKTSFPNYWVQYTKLK